MQKNDQTVTIWKATWIFYTKYGEIKSPPMVTPYWHDDLHLLLDIGYHVLKAANAACGDYKECFKQFILIQGSELPKVKAIHYEREIGESILSKSDYLFQYGIRVETGSGSDDANPVLDPDDDF